MSTFALESGRLVPVGPRDVIPEGFNEDWCALVREDVLELVQCEAFAVAWDAGRPRLLTAMAADGALLGVTVLPRLDLDMLSELLVRGGGVVSLSWAQAAARYHNGLGAFRRDWNTFREARVVPVEPEPRLIVVTGWIAPEVLDALPLLDQVRLIRAQVRRGAAGAELLELRTVDWKNRGAEDAAGAGASGPTKASSAKVPYSQGARRRPETAPPTPGHIRAGGARAARRASRSRMSPGPRAPRETGPGAPREFRARRQGPPSTPTPVIQPQAPRPPAEPERPQSGEPAVPPRAPQPVSAEAETLALVATLLGAPIPIALYYFDRVHQRATLQPGGRIVLPDGTEYTELTRACADILGPDHPDPWQAWRFADGQFAMAEARAEALRFHSRNGRPR